MYDWDTAYVSKILHDPVYTGNLTVAERPTKTMRSKKRQYIPYAEREVIYGTHEPIIEQNRWNNVRRFWRADRPLSGKVQADMTTFSGDYQMRRLWECHACQSRAEKKAEQRIRQDFLLLYQIPQVWERGLFITHH